MKKTVFSKIFVGFVLFATHMLHACPTCLGRVQKGLPPFYTKDFPWYETQNNKEAVSPTASSYDENAFVAGDAEKNKETP